MPKERPAGGQFSNSFACSVRSKDIATCAEAEFNGKLSEVSFRYSKRR